MGPIITLGLKWFAMAVGGGTGLGAAGVATYVMARGAEGTCDYVGNRFNEYQAHAKEDRAIKRSRKQRQKELRQRLTMVTPNLPGPPPGHSYTVAPLNTPVVPVSAPTAQVG